MSEQIKVTISCPPYRKQHVAEIGLVTNEILEPGTHGTYCGIGEIVTENGILELELFPAAESERRVFNLMQFMKALEDGKKRLLERYPDLAAADEGDSLS